MLSLNMNQKKKQWKQNNLNTLYVKSKLRKNAGAIFQQDDLNTLYVKSKPIMKLEREAGVTLFKYIIC